MLYRTQRYREPATPSQPATPLQPSPSASLQRQAIAPSPLTPHGVKRKADSDEQITVPRSKRQRDLVSLLQLIPESS